MRTISLVLLSLAAIIIPSASTTTVGWSSLTGGPAQTFFLAGNNNTDEWNVQFSGDQGKAVALGNSQIILGPNGFENGNLLVPYPESSPLEIVTFNDRVLFREQYSLNLYTSTGSFVWANSASYNSIAVCGQVIYAANGAVLHSIDISSGYSTHFVYLESAVNVTCDPVTLGVVCMNATMTYELSSSLDLSSFTFLFASRSPPFHPSVDVDTGSMYTVTDASLARFSRTGAGCGSWASSCVTWVTQFIAARKQVAIDTANGLLFVIGAQPGGPIALWSVNLYTGALIAQNTNIMVGQITVNPILKIVSVSSNTGFVSFFSYTTYGSLNALHTSSDSNSATFYYTRMLSTPLQFIFLSYDNECKQIGTVSPSNLAATNIASFSTGQEILSLPYCPSSDSSSFPIWAIVLLSGALSCLCCCCIVAIIKKKRCCSNNTSYNAMLADRIPVGIVTGTTL